jgi:polyribonucleotide nucleotidyltransferase
MMVESEAKELSEEDARRRDVRPSSMQPVIDAIIELAEQAAKEPFDFDRRQHRRCSKARPKDLGKDIAAAYKITTSRAPGRRRDR